MVPPPDSVVRQALSPESKAVLGCRIENVMTFEYGEPQKVLLLESMRTIARGRIPIGVRCSDGIARSRLQHQPDYSHRLSIMQLAGNRLAHHGIECI